MNKIQCPKGHYYDADMFSECPHCKRKGESKTEAIPFRFHERHEEKPWRVSEPLAEQEEKTVVLQAHEVSGSSEEKTVGFFEHWHSDPKPSVPAAEAEQVEASKPQEAEAPIPAQSPQFEADSEKTQFLWSTSKSVQEEPKPEKAADPAPREEEILPPVDPIVGWLVCVQGRRYGECFTIGAGKNSIGRGADNRISIAGDAQVSRSQHAYIIYEPRSRKFYLQPGNSSGLTYLNQQLVLLPELLKERDEIGLNESRFLFIPLCNESFSWEPSA